MLLGMSTTVRLSESTRDRFAVLSAKTGRPMTQLLDDAATALERELFFSSFESGYEALRDDPAAWRSVLEERRIEGGSISDSSAP